MTPLDYAQDKMISGWIFLPILGVAVIYFLLNWWKDQP